MNPELASTYSLLFDEVLSPASRRLEDFLVHMIDGAERVDRISARAKSPARFMAKAEKLKDDGVTLKYDDPLSQIQDQIGARITVFYIQDVNRVREIALTYLKPIEFQRKEPIGNAEFGYFGEHFVMKLPDDVVAEGDEERAPEFFELQIKTLFQHAWSEADHDLGYKSTRDLSPLEQRQVAFSAAQSWGADQIFAQLAGKLVFANENDEGLNSSAI